MKKISIFLLALVCTFLVTGCQSSKVESATCTSKEEGYAQEVTYYATAGEIDKMKLKITYDNSLFGVESFSTYSDSQKEEMKSTMLKNLGLEKTNYEGLDIVVEIDDQLVVTIDADIAKADPEILKKIGMDFAGVDMDFDKTISESEASGATCKRK